MDEDLIRNCRRWLNADEAGHDDEADARLMTVLEATRLAQPAPSPEFTAGVIAAVSAAANRDARMAWWTRRALVAGGTTAAVLAVYLGGAWALAALSSALVWSLDALVGVVVRMAMAIRTGGPVWGVLTSLGRAASAFASDSTVTLLMVAIQVIALGALAALGRLLGEDKEWLK